MEWMGLVREIYSPQGHSLHLSRINSLKIAFRDGFHEAKGTLHWLAPAIISHFGLTNDVTDSVLCWSFFANWKTS